MSLLDKIIAQKRKNTNPPRPGEKTIKEWASDSHLSLTEARRRLIELEEAGYAKKVQRLVPWSGGLRHVDHYYESKPSK